MSPQGKGCIQRGDFREKLDTATRKVALVIGDWKNFTMKEQKAKKIYNKDREKIEKKIKIFA